MKRDCYRLIYTYEPNEPSAVLGSSTAKSRSSNNVRASRYSSLSQTYEESLEALLIGQSSHCLWTQASAITGTDNSQCQWESLAEEIYIAANAIYVSDSVGMFIVHFCHDRQHHPRACRHQQSAHHSRDYLANPPARNLHNS